MNIRQQYRSGQTIAQIAAARGLPESKVRRFLIASGVEMRQQSRRRKADIPGAAK